MEVRVVRLFWVMAGLLVAAVGCESRGTEASAELAGERLVGQLSPEQELNPEVLFRRFQCAGCHQKGMPFHVNLVMAREKPVEEIAHFIRHAQQVKPGAAMPDYSKQLTEEQAVALADWIKEGHP
jgi:mono/diheme cytochrome c family protein